MISSFTDLQVYKDSYQLALEISRATFSLPNAQKYDLIDQMLRASKSIPANIAEGYAKKVSEKEFKKYLFMAIGSCNEMVVHISFTRDLGFLPEELCHIILRRYDFLGKQLNKLTQNWKTYPKPLS